MSSLVLRKILLQDGSFIIFINMVIIISGMYLYKILLTHVPCTSRINVTPKESLPISKVHSILAVANLLAHNNISQICLCGRILLQSAAVDCSFSDNLTPLR